jgi:hypothetical protein
MPRFYFNLNQKKMNMKKGIFLLMMCMQVALTFGQMNRFEAGLEGGPAMTTLWGNDLLENKMNTGGTYYNALHYTQGAFFRWNLLPWLGLQTGVNYEKVGMYLDFESENSGGSSTNDYGRAELEYMSFPLLVKFQIGNRLKWNVTAGGFLSYLLRAWQISYYELYAPNGEMAFEVTNNFERLNAGVAFGVGLDYAFKNGINIGFETRDQLGLYNTSALPVVNNQFVRTNSLQFMARVSYKFGYPKTNI